MGSATLSIFAATSLSAGFNPAAALRNRVNAGVAMPSADSPATRASRAADKLSTVAATVCHAELSKGREERLKDPT